jgi:PLP dependent protein
MIGHLQTNKVKQAAHVFGLVQSVDSPSLANEIGRRAGVLGRTTDVLVEVNISGEASKFGVRPEDTQRLCDEIVEIPGISLRGLMGIAPFVSDESAMRRSFVALRGLWNGLPPENRKWLSMGMSADFEMAIEEGSNMVRVGTAIFGPRT